MTALAAAMRITPRAVSSYERDGAPAGRADLLETLGCPAAFFRRPGVELLEDDRVSFRARRRTSASQRAAATAAGRIGIEVYDWVVDRFRTPEPNLVDLDHEDPRRAAETLRATWGCGRAPLPNLVHLAESQGVRVLSLPPGAADVDAFILWHDGVPYVFLSLAKTPERSRFDLAHELGHLVMHSRGDAPSGGREPEREADDFASALLMPEEELQARVGREAAVPEIVRAKRTFGVSAMALNRSLHVHGRMSDWTYRQNCVRLSQLGYRSAEPDGGRRERSQVFRLVLEALRGRGVGAVQIAADLGLTPEDIHDLTFGIAVVPLAGPSSRVRGGAHPEPRVLPALRVVGGG